MSASLVGSEMCIRDSNTPLRSYFPTHHKPRLLDHISLPTTTLTQPTHPVSYTHLTLPTICSV
eukprot:9413402-Alexandrium_andersonii.AAC.1